MTRAVLMVVVSLALGCGGDDGGEPLVLGARVDGVPVDGDGDAIDRQCDASPETPPQQTTGGATTGDWFVT